MSDTAPTGVTRQKAAPLVLGFDCSGPYISAVLLRGEGEVLSDLHETMARGQAEALFPLLEDMLARGGAGWRDLSALGIAVGPGNFTGIRIGVSAVRGLALSLGIPAVGISLMEALALNARGPVLTSVEAPRDQAYVQGFGMTRDPPLSLMRVADIPPEWAEPGLASTGSAGAAIAAHLGVPHEPAAHAPGSAVARLAARRWQECTEPPVPLYLKPADAAPPRDAPPVILDDLR